MGKKNTTQSALNKSSNIFLKNTKRKLVGDRIFNNSCESKSLDSTETNQCVFLGALRLKPVPNIFQVKLEPISSIQSNRRILYNNNKSKKITNRRKLTFDKKSELKTEVSSKIHKNLYIGNVSDPEFDNKILKLISKVKQSVLKNRLQTSVDIKSDDLSDSKYCNILGYFVGAERNLRKKEIDFDHNSNEIKPYEELKKKGFSKRSLLKTQNKFLSKLKITMSTPKLNDLENFPDNNLEIMNINNNIHKNVQHTSSAKDMAVENVIRRLRQKKSIEVKNVNDVDSKFKRIIPIPDSKPKSEVLDKFELHSTISETFPVEKQEILSPFLVLEDDDIEDFLEIDQNVVEGLSALIPEEEIESISNSLIQPENDIPMKSVEDSMIPERKVENSVILDESLSDPIIISDSSKCEDNVLDVKSQGTVIEIEDDNKIQNEVLIEPKKPKVSYKPIQESKIGTVNKNVIETVTINNNTSICEIVQDIVPEILPNSEPVQNSKRKSENTSPQPKKKKNSPKTDKIQSRKKLTQLNKSNKDSTKNLRKITDFFSPTVKCELPEEIKPSILPQNERETLKKKFAVTINTLEIFPSEINDLEIIEPTQRSLRSRSKISPPKSENEEIRPSQVNHNLEKENTGKPIKIPLRKTKVNKNKKKVTQKDENLVEDTEEFIEGESEEVLQTSKINKFTPKDDDSEQKSRESMWGQTSETNCSQNEDVKMLNDSVFNIKQTKSSEVINDKTNIQLKGKISSTNAVLDNEVNIEDISPNNSIKKYISKRQPGRICKKTITKTNKGSDKLEETNNSLEESKVTETDNADQFEIKTKLETRRNKRNSNENHVFTENKQLNTQETSSQTQQITGIEHKENPLEQNISLDTTENLSEKEKTTIKSTPAKKVTKKRNVSLRKNIVTNTESSDAINNETAINYENNPKLTPVETNLNEENTKVKKKPQKRKRTNNKQSAKTSINIANNQDELLQKTTATKLEIYDFDDKSDESVEPLETTVKRRKYKKVKTGETTSNISPDRNNQTIPKKKIKSENANNNTSNTTESLENTSVLDTSTDLSSQDSTMSVDLKSSDNFLNVSPEAGNEMNQSGQEWKPVYGPYKRIDRCNVCLLYFKSYQKLRAHKKEHEVANPYKCWECDDCFEDVEQLAAHLRIHRGKMPYPCKKCDATFWTSFQLERHQLVHVLKKVPPPTRPPSKVFKCEVCSKQFKKICDLERHTRVHTGEKPSVCNICNKRFQQAYNLNKHLYTHTQEKNFECVICQKKFGRNDVLNRHVLTHSIIKPFKCSICSRTFIRNSQLKLHLRKHHNLDKDPGSQVIDDPGNDDESVAGTSTTE